MFRWKTKTLADKKEHFFGRFPWENAARESRRRNPCQQNEDFRQFPKNIQRYFSSAGGMSRPSFTKAMPMSCSSTSFFR